MSEKNFRDNCLTPKKHRPPPPLLIRYMLGSFNCQFNCRHKSLYLLQLQVKVPEEAKVKDEGEVKVKEDDLVPMVLYKAVAV